MERIQVQRVYGESAPLKGERYLVDRLWPRGVKKDQLQLAGWPKETAPSAELRDWYHHDLSKWDEFRKRYFAELDGRPDAWKPLADAARRGPIVLLYASKEEQYNNAVALKQYLEAHLKRGA